MRSGLPYRCTWDELQRVARRGRGEWTLISNAGLRQLMSPGDDQGVVCLAKYLLRHGISGHSFRLMQSQLNLSITISRGD